MMQRMKKLEEENLRLAREVQELFFKKRERARQRDAYRVRRVHCCQLCGPGMRLQAPERLDMETALRRDQGGLDGLKEAWTDYPSQCTDPSRAPTMSLLRLLDEEITNSWPYAEEMADFVRWCAETAAAREIKMWLQCSKRLKVCRDIRQKIAKLLWETRMQE
jgi:hypothetical protein